MRISDWSSDVCSSDLLVVGGEREGDAELHRRQREAAPEDRRAAVEGGDARAALMVVAVGLQLRDDLRRDVVLDLLVVGRDVAPGAVEVQLAHLERVLAEREGDLLDEALAADHALRAAEAAEGGVRAGARKSTRLTSSH